MSSGLYSHTTRGVGTVLTAAIYNADHQNHITNQNPSMTGAYSDNVGQMQDTDDPGGVGTESLAPDLAGELTRLRHMIKAITGEAQWYSPPDTTMAAIAGGNFGDLVIADSLELSGDLTPAQITANQNNYAPTDHATTFRFRLDTDASRNLTGLAGPQPGRVVSIVNVGSFNLVLKNQDAASTDVNRFLLGGDLTLKPNQSVLLHYDDTTDRWRPFGPLVLDNLAVVGTLSVAGDASFVNKSQTGYTDITEMAAPAAPAANSVRVYCRDEGGVSELYMKRSDNSERTLGGSDLIETKTTNSGTTADFDNLVLAPYTSVIILLDGVSPDADNSTPLLLLSDDAGASFENIAGVAGSASSGDQVFRVSDIAATTGFNLTRGSIDNAQTDLFGMIEIFLPGVAATRKMGRAHFGWGPGGSWDMNISMFASVSMGAINKIRLDWIGGTAFDAGTVKLIGIR